MIFMIVLLTLAAAALIAVHIGMWLSTKGKKNLAPGGWTDLKDMSSYVQSCITVVVLILGAGWAVYTWKTQWDDHKESEQRTQEGEKAAIEIEISAKQITPPNTKPNNGWFIGGDITIKNAGTRTEWLKFDKGPLFVARIKSIPNFNKEPKGTNPCEERKLILDTPKAFWLSRPQISDRPDIEVGDEIRPGATDVYHFLINVAQPGTYAVILSLDVPSKESQGPALEFYNPCDHRTLKYQNRWESSAFFVEVNKKGPRKASLE